MTLPTERVNFPWRWIAPTCAAALALTLAACEQVAPPSSIGGAGDAAAQRSTENDHPTDPNRPTPAGPGDAAGAPESLRLLRDLGGPGREDHLNTLRRGGGATRLAGQVLAWVPQGPTSDRRHAIDLLAALGAAAIPPLTAALASSDQGSQLVALAAAGRIGTDAAALAEPIRALITSDNPAVKSFAQQALGRVTGDTSDPRFGK